MVPVGTLIVVTRHLGPFKRKLHFGLSLAEAAARSAALDARPVLRQQEADRDEPHPQQ